MRRACVSAVRSEAQHRSVSVARSTPTRASVRDTPKKSFTYSDTTQLFCKNKQIYLSLRLLKIWKV
ncbi:MAG: hypothetical protein NZ455_05830 [Bacteroidia bacterium]|nr:hypothetical protein [Bacteroidia bacterium]MDW8347804.1 hypothetical protein [Bacteroidia bacterium]